MTTKLTAAEGWAQVFKTIIDECDPQALTEADGYVWRYVANQRKEIERLRAENARFRAVVEALRTSVEQRSAQLEARGKGGQSCGEFGEFVSVPPSALHRLQWYLREFDKIGAGT